jgi:ArsR family transcriptional regulator, arsenate/arsenite/antimonite-responsive transcriptional repressor
MVTDLHAVWCFSALAHAVRLQAFRLLVKAGPSGMPSGEIAEALQVPPTAMSFHLSTLERSGLLASRRVGRKIFYAVQYEQVRALLAFLTEDCCGGRPELCGSLGLPEQSSMEAERQ